ncbi:hypothetical protein SBI67_08390 [Mycolicibacterium sp. 120266]|uniref:hypothetical protein n=1 Tax=Mycolicibacterium sp. 120266 TaxID=3090601 RepID=UPI00299D5256|nr:hypothetical protein [Mycolicibacterium sp. 120266]MDX1872135.1 hypothetical protein [Mycolicibacterium sp. 120266]
MDRDTDREPPAWRHYQRIQAYKSDPRSVIDGVNYAHVIALYLYDRSFRHWVKIIVFCFLFTARTTVSGRGERLLNFYSYRYKKRSDYDYIADRLVAIVGNQGDAAEVREVLSIAQSWATLLRLPRAWRSTSAYQSRFMHRVAATALVAKFSSTTRSALNDLVSGRTRVVTFCDAAPHDNLLAQIAILAGASTVTAQHGQYRVLDQRNISTDAEAYANFVSDHLLCWGEATRNEFERFGIRRDRLVITGWIRHWDPVSRPETATGTFGVMLNGENGADSNIDLLDAANRIAEELDMRFVVRLHPSFDSREYRTRVNERCTSISAVPTGEYVSNVDFSLAHMSGATIEMLEVDSPVYVLDDGRLADAFQLPGLSFEGVEAVLETVRADMMDPASGNARTRKLKRWFNDDTGQDARIRSALLIAQGV